MLREKPVFSSLKSVKAPKWSKVLAYTLVGLFLLLAAILSFTPWQQSSRGEGTVTAFDPDNRIQDVNAPVSGRINQWHVRDGSKVKKGDPLVQIVDNDPMFVERLEMELKAAKQKLEAASDAAETALRNLRRQRELYQQGLASSLEYEKARIEHKKLLSEEAQAGASLAQAKVKLARQESQLVKAPRDGTVLRVLLGSGSVFVKEGDTLAVFVPDTAVPAAEIYIDGNDLALVYPGRKARLQFEGWPAVQFSGWPSLAVGTFGGVVALVDPSASKNGRFRVLIVPEEGSDWPDSAFLRQGARVYGWVLLDTVRLGYEVWRKLNGFPPEMTRPLGGDGPDGYEKDPKGLEKGAR